MNNLIDVLIGIVGITGFILLAVGLFALLPEKVKKKLENFFFNRD